MKSIRQALAVTITFSLVILSPGLNCYQALGATVDAVPVDAGFGQVGGSEFLGTSHVDAAAQYDISTWPKDGQERIDNTITDKDQALFSGAEAPIYATDRAETAEAVSGQALTTEGETSAVIGDAHQTLGQGLQRVTTFVGKIGSHIAVGLNAADLRSLFENNTERDSAAESPAVDAHSPEVSAVAAGSLQDNNTPIQVGDAVIAGGSKVKVIGVDAANGRVTVDLDSAFNSGGPTQEFSINDVALTRGSSHGINIDDKVLVGGVEGKVAGIYAADGSLSVSFNSSFDEGPYQKVAMSQAALPQGSSHGISVDDDVIANGVWGEVIGIYPADGGLSVKFNNAHDGATVENKFAPGDVAVPRGSSKGISVEDKVKVIASGALGTVRGVFALDGSLSVSLENKNDDGVMKRFPRSQLALSNNSNRFNPGIGNVSLLRAAMGFGLALGIAAGFAFILPGAVSWAAVGAMAGFLFGAALISFKRADNTNTRAILAVGELLTGIVAGIGGAVAGLFAGHYLAMAHPSYWVATAATVGFLSLWRLAKTSDTEAIQRAAATPSMEAIAIAPSASLIEAKPAESVEAVTEDAIPGIYSASVPKFHFNFKSQIKLNADHTAQFIGEPDDYAARDASFGQGQRLVSFSGKGTWELKDGQLSVELNGQGLGRDAEPAHYPMSAAIAIDLSKVGQDVWRAGMIQAPATYKVSDVYSTFLTQGMWSLSRDISTSSDKTSSSAQNTTAKGPSIIGSIIHNPYFQAAATAAVILGVSGLAGIVLGVHSVAIAMLVGSLFSLIPLNPRNIDVPLWSGVYLAIAVSVLAVIFGSITASAAVGPIAAVTVASSHSPAILGSSALALRYFMGDMKDVSTSDHSLPSGSVVFEPGILGSLGLRTHYTVVTADNIHDVGATLRGKTVRVFTVYDSNKWVPPVIKTVWESVTYKSVYNPNGADLRYPPMVGAWYTYYHNPPMAFQVEEASGYWDGVRMVLRDAAGNSYAAYRRSSSYDLKVRVESVADDGQLVVDNGNGLFSYIKPEPGMKILIAR